MVESTKPTVTTKPKATTTVSAKASTAIKVLAKAPAKTTPGGKANIDDYECPICLTFCVQPVLTPCKHLFCLPCHK